MDEKASSHAAEAPPKVALSPVRLQEVAQAAGVSTITVSRCISNPNRVSKKTLEHVLKVAAAMGYIPNRLASSLASAKSMVVGIVVPTIANPIHGVIMQGVADLLEPAGYQILLGNSHFSKRNEMELVRTFLGHRVDGILLTGKDHAQECIDMLARSRTPVRPRSLHFPAAARPWTDVRSPTSWRQVRRRFPPQAIRAPQRPSKRR